MGRTLISPWRLAHARQQGDRLLRQECSIYRPDPNGVLPTNPTFTQQKCSVEMVNRLANPEPAPRAEGMPPETPIRFDVRFNAHQDIRPRDMIRITADEIDPTWIDQEFTVVGVRTPAEYALFMFADAEEGA